MKRFVALIVVAVFCGCSTPSNETGPAVELRDGAVSPADQWFDRAVEIVMTSKDDDEIRGRMAALWCEIMNPGGDHAGMSADERHAAVLSMARGWAEAAKARR